MNILVACEESQVVCKAFRNRGHNAFSCDIIPCSGGHPEWHIMWDALALVNGRCSFLTCDGELHKITGRWDMLIAFPPCTFITNAGARWLWAGGKLNKERYEKGVEGAAFLMSFLNADCDKICVENPVSSSIYNLPKYQQIIQPYQFGHPYSKATTLRLKGLPPLKPTNEVDEYVPYVSSGMYTKTHDPKFKGASRAGGAAKMRSKTFTGIGQAMAEQWG